MPKGSDSFTYREEQDRIKAANVRATQDMSLVQRTNTEKPTIPSLVTTGTVRQQQSRSQEVMPVPPEAPHTIRLLNVNEFISQEREIFLVQLMIDRKRAEIAHLSVEIQAEEAALITRDAEIAETSNQYKMSTAQAEAALARARKASEIAMKKRMDLLKEFKLATQSVSLIRADISKNRETLDSYREYRDFMDRLVPEQEDPETFYTSPEVLIGELDHQERCDLFLVQVTQESGLELDKRLGKVSVQLDATDVQIEGMATKARKVPIVEERDFDLTEGDVKNAAAIEKELADLHRMVSRVYCTCFGPGSSIGALSMLKKIEAVLERQYIRIQTVNSTFAQTIQKKKDEARSEQQRLELEAKKEAEQKLKYDQALERAQMPIKKRTGRPPVKRMLPNQGERVDPERFQAEALERARIHTLLYEAETE
jgi:hypothetical protein